MARSKHLQNKSGIFWYLCRSNLALFLVRVHIYNVTHHPPYGCVYKL